MARLPSHLISFHLQDGDRRIIAALTALQLTHQNAQLAAHILRLVLFPRPFQDLLGMDAIAEHDDLITLLQLQTQTVWLDPVSYTHLDVYKRQAQGHEEERLNSIKSLMETLNLTIDQAMQALKIPSSEREKYAQMLK